MNEPTHHGLLAALWLPVPIVTKLLELLQGIKHPYRHYYSDLVSGWRPTSRGQTSYQNCSQKPRASYRGGNNGIPVSRDRILSGGVYE